MEVNAEFAGAKQPVRACCCSIRGQNALGFTGFGGLHRLLDGQWGRVGRAARISFLAPVLNTRSKTIRSSERFFAGATHGVGRTVGTKWFRTFPGTYESHRLTNRHRASNSPMPAARG